MQVGLRDILIHLQMQRDVWLEYHMMCKVYTDVGGIKKKLCHVCPHVLKKIHSLKLVDYLNVQANNPWYNYYYLGRKNTCM